jgi:hypothetical protein
LEAILLLKGILTIRLIKLTGGAKFFYKNPDQKAIYELSDIFDSPDLPKNQKNLSQN